MARKTVLMAVLVVLGTPWLASAWRVQDAGRQPHASATAIDTTVFVGKGMIDRKVVKEIVIGAPPAKVFETFTTPDGWKRFFHTNATIELRIGGPWEHDFAGPGTPDGLRGSEGCQVLSYVPNRMVSFSWSAPPKFPEERAKRTWVVVFFDADGADNAKVTLVHTGFGEGGHWAEVQKYFDVAWEKVLGELQSAFKK